MSDVLLRCITILKKYFNFSDVISNATSSCCNAALILNHVSSRCGMRGSRTHSRVRTGQMPYNGLKSHCSVHVCVCVAGGWMINACQYGHVYVCQFNLFVDAFVKLWVYVFVNQTCVYVCVCFCVQQKHKFIVVWLFVQTDVKKAPSVFVSN